MDWHVMETHFSVARTRRYLNAFEGNVVRAASAYDQNMLLGQALMPMFHALEVGLRNAVHARLSLAFGRSDWWENLPAAEFGWSLREIAGAKEKLARRHESQAPDKVVAELTFAFWTALFNARHQDSLWAHLRLAFPHCPKEVRQRKRISGALNSVRDLRNRVFHHEPLLWIRPHNVDQCHTRGREAIGWLDPRLVAWLDQHDQVKTRWQICTRL
jgi:hypothetical protein